MHCKHPTLKANACWTALAGQDDLQRLLEGDSNGVSHASPRSVVVDLVNELNCGLANGLGDVFTRSESVEVG
jgi:hypothetical protein